VSFWIIPGHVSVSSPGFQFNYRLYCFVPLTTSEICNSFVLFEPIPGLLRAELCTESNRFGLRLQFFAVPTVLTLVAQFATSKSHFQTQTHRSASHRTQFPFLINQLGLIEVDSASLSSLWESAAGLSSAASESCAAAPLPPAAKSAAANLLPGPSSCFSGKTRAFWFAGLGTSVIIADNRPIARPTTTAIFAPVIGSAEVTTGFSADSALKEQFLIYSGWFLTYSFVTVL
jgi:hypothetical protein